MNLLLVSSSSCHGYGYLEHCETATRELLSDSDEVVFVPYARPGGRSHDEYTAVAKERFLQLGIKLTGIHEFQDARSAVANAPAVFIGGGNSFVLLAELYRQDLLKPLQNRISAGMPYMGTSAGSNVAGMTIKTTNDMPIAYPPSFDAIQAVPFNINPHFPATRPDPTHKGETRRDRLTEFHIFNSTPVVAIHEDGMLRVRGRTMQLIGERPAYVLRPSHEEEFAPNESRAISLEQ